MTRTAPARRKPASEVLRDLCALPIDERRMVFAALCPTCFSEVFPCGCPSRQAIKMVAPAQLSRTVGHA